MLNTVDNESSGPEPTRDEALRRLEEFVPRAGRAYASTRNYDHGPSDRSNVSLLSPYIRHRLILEEEVLKVILGRQRFSAAEKFIQEVFWRTYFKGWLEHRPQVWHRYRADVAALANRLKEDDGLSGSFEAAVTGNTGIDCFDAWARELVDTGYLHNHARMWFASIWIFTLRLPWQLGADFFYRHLLDGDAASNTLGWRWVAGLHTKGKTYLARPSNIARYTDGRFNPEGRLASTAPALSEPDIGPPVPPQVVSGGHPDESFGLLITEDDCFAESLDLPASPAAVIGLTAAGARSPLTISPQVDSFAHSAIADALTRSAMKFGVEMRQESGDNWVPALVDWASKLDLRVIATAYTPVGPAAERLDAAEPALKDAGLRLMRISRPYDVLTWPHATKGFFALKSKIPALIGKLGLAPLTECRP